MFDLDIDEDEGGVKPGGNTVNTALAMRHPDVRLAPAPRLAGTALSSARTAASWHNGANAPLGGGPPARHHLVYCRNAAPMDGFAIGGRCVPQRRRKYIARRVAAIGAFSA
jgi:hypothetical protein